MALPYTFANVSVLQTPQIDANFAALGALVVIPCTATGTNTIALTPTSNTPTVSAYTSLAPVFAFFAAATSNGAVTININGIGAKSLYKSGGAVAAGSGDLVSGNLYLIAYNSSLNSSAGGFVTVNPSTNRLPNVQRLTSTTPGLTFTPTPGDVLWRVRMWGPGGGGGGGTANVGSNGSAATSFQVNGTGTAWTAAVGAGGAANAGASGAGGSGGTNGSTGTLFLRETGGQGGYGQSTATANTILCGGYGGNSPFLGGGGAAAQQSNGFNGVTNTGGGGSGGGGNSATNTGGGGGSGEYVEFWVTGMTTATYTIGTGGAGGIAGTRAGGNGADGTIIVEGFPGI